KQMEAIKISLENPAYEGDIEYRVHSADIGWQSWTGNGETAGVTGRNKQMEAIEIRFTGEMEKEYDIYYRAHIADYGWLDWTANGKSAGSEGLSKRIEAIEIRVVQKGGNAPGATGRPFIKK
ncbi:Ig domain-containing protein, partial [[Clostridium] cocleatum]|nr:Ig domain-containing protein [Thomasclavelia cocleata]